MPVLATGQYTIKNIDNGAKWYSGTSITGTSTTETMFSGSGVEYAVVGDMYLNTSTNNAYKCTFSGNPNTAKWVYVANVKGDAGSKTIFYGTRHWSQEQMDTYVVGYSTSWRQTIGVAVNKGDIFIITVTNTNTNKTSDLYIQATETTTTSQSAQGKIISVVSDGLNGAKGDTPVKGTDYFTAEEIADIEKNAADKVSVGGRNLYYLKDFDKLEKTNVQSSSVDNGEITLTAKGADLYIGQVLLNEETWTSNHSPLMNVEGASFVTFKISNPLFTKNFYNFLDEDKKAISKYTGVPSSQKTITVPDGAKYLSMRFGCGSAVSGTTYKFKIKVETGNKATDWTPAPEDVSQEISSLSSTISGVSLVANKAKQDIESKVWEEDIENHTYSDGSTMSSIRSRVSQTETNINGITNTVSDVNSSIGSSEIYAYDGETTGYDKVPTLSNKPAVDWTSSEKENKIGSIYISENTYYLFQGIYDGDDIVGYEWKLIDNADVAKLAIQVMQNVSKINQTSEEIELNVFKKDSFNGENIITSINASTEGVKISAKQVDIKGDLVVNSVNGNVQIGDGKIKASQLNVDDVFSNSVVSERIISSVVESEKISTIKLDSKVGSIGGFSITDESICTDKNLSFGGRNLFASTSKNWKTIQIGQYYSIVAISNDFFGLNAGDTFTYRLKIKDADRPLKARLQFYNSESDRYGQVSKEVVENGKEGYSSITYTLTERDRSYSGMHLMITNGDTTISSTSTCYIKEVKLEKGNKATDWTPCPEDSYADIKESGGLILKDNGEVFFGDSSNHFELYNDESTGEKKIGVVTGNVLIDDGGIEVLGNDAGVTTKIKNSGLYGYYQKSSSGEENIVFQIEKDVTKTDKLLVNNGLEFSQTIKEIPITYNGIKGIVDVKSV